MKTSLSLLPDGYLFTLSAGVLRQYTRTVVAETQARFIDEQVNGTTGEEPSAASLADDLAVSLEGYAAAQAVAADQVRFGGEELRKDVYGRFENLALHLASMVVGLEGQSDSGDRPLVPVADHSDEGDFFDSRL